MTYNTTYDTISTMSALNHNFSYFLRNSGELLTAVEHGDVRLDRRDGSDLLLVTESREASVRESLEMATRALARVLSNTEHRRAGQQAFVEALPWLGWLSTPDQQDFLDSFITTSQACHATGGYGPLQKLLASWKASAQILHDPELVAYLNADRGVDEEVALSRPE